MLTSGEGEWLHRRFTSAVQATLVPTSAHGRPRVAFSQLKAAEHFTLNDVTPEDAYTLHVNRVPWAELNVRRGQKRMERHSLPLNGAAIYDLTDLAMMSQETRYENTRVYLPRDRLRETAHDMGCRGDFRLIQPEFGFLDATVIALAAVIDQCFTARERAAQLFVDHLALAVQCHLVQNYAAQPVSLRTIRGGLSPWQERRAKELIAANLAAPLTIAELAADCGLSPSHFARAFRRSTGQAPHQWLMECRIDRARSLLSGSAHSLADIAALCGFADRSHLGRVFLRHFGESPGTWRRHLAAEAG